MIKNYIKIALRNLLKDKTHAFINISGLAIGLACCLLIMLFVRNEWSYDRFHTRSDDLYRAWVLEDYGEDEQFFNTVTPIVLGPTLATSFPEIEHVVRVGTFADLVQRGETTLQERVHYVDPAFFEAFDFPLLRGSAVGFAGNPNTVMLTPDLAVRYFGQTDPLGQTLSIRVGQDFQDFVIGGIVEAAPGPSSIQYDLLVPFAKAGDLFSERQQQSWFSVNVETYVLLHDNVPSTALDPKFPTMIRQVLGERVPEGAYTIGLQPMTAIHLDPSFPLGIAPISDPAYSYILSAIALLVLLIACINFMTLSIGRSASRALEVGVRKVIGAHRRQLMHQFWGEALLTTVLALILGVALAEAFRSLFNTLAGTDLAFRFDGGMLLFMGTLTLLIGLVAGSYPAAVLSGFRPVDVLKGKLSLGGDTNLLRRGLVVIQFALSIFLIAGTLIMARQLTYLQTKNLGFDEEQVVVIPTSGTPTQGQGLASLLENGLRTAERLRNELAANPAILNVTASAHTFGEGWISIGYDADDGTYRTFSMNIVDASYLPTMDMTLTAGRNFSLDIPSDAPRALIVNEAMAAEYGWEDPIGQRLPGASFEDHEIIGVVHDFNFEPLHGNVRPLVLVLNPRLILQGSSDVNFSASPTPKISVRIAPDDEDSQASSMSGTLTLIERTWQRVAPDQPYNYAFLDEALDRQYRQEERLGQIVGIASLLAVVIACLGLFGLAALAVVRRTKEIGVRKVMGASTSGLVLLLSKDFTLLVLVAFVLAVPAAYLVMDAWLQDFAYRIDLGAGTFVLAGVLAFAIALLTVSVQAVKAALADPVKSLRYE
ncbi:MAG: ABC transporter permease [Rhodothermales bacterium]